MGRDERSKRLKQRDIDFNIPGVHWFVIRDLNN